MWNYNFETMPKDGSKFIFCSRSCSGVTYAYSVFWDEECQRWIDLETGARAALESFRCWAPLPKEYENENTARFIEYYEKEFLETAQHFLIDYYQGLKVLRDWAQEKLLKEKNPLGKVSHE